MIFTEKTFNYLRDLANNNNRDWFNDNKERYEENVRLPALTLIEAIRPQLVSIAPHFRASAKKTGGSLMRIYRDIRFSKDKTPYKTNIGIQFRHELGKDIHAPGFYLHIQPDNVFLGAGIWRPDNKTLGLIRDMLLDNPSTWKQLISNKKFAENYELTGESLIKPPRGYPKDHPLINDLKRKDFIAIHEMKKKDVLSNNFPEMIIQSYSVTIPFMQYLCTALELQL